MIIGLMAVTFLIALTALISGWRVRSTDDFTVTGRRAGWRVVSGIIVSALVGGSSTVGTAQAAFVYGLPAWWFTLGAGIGCVMLATLFAKPMRRSAVETLPQYLVCTFGNPIRPLVAVSDSIGIFLTIPGQAASAIALLAVLLRWPAAPVFILVSLLVIAYVFMGGAAPLRWCSAAVSPPSTRHCRRGISIFSATDSGRIRATGSVSCSAC